MLIESGNFRRGLIALHEPSPFICDTFDTSYRYGGFDIVEDTTLKSPIYLATMEETTYKMCDRFTGITISKVRIKRRLLRGFQLSYRGPWDPLLIVHVIRKSTSTNRELGGCPGGGQMTVPTEGQNEQW